MPPPTERHHFISRRAIKSARGHVNVLERRGEDLTEQQHRLLYTPLSKLLSDERNLVDLDPRRHHRVTHGFEKLTLADAPKVQEFAAEYALEAKLADELKAFT